LLPKVLPTVRAWVAAGTSSEMIATNPPATTRE